MLVTRVMRGRRGKILSFVLMFVHANYISLGRVPWSSSRRLDTISSDSGEVMIPPEADRRQKSQSVHIARCQPGKFGNKISSFFILFPNFQVFYLFLFIFHSRHRHLRGCDGQNRQRTRNTGTHSDCLRPTDGGPRPLPPECVAVTPDPRLVHYQ